MLEFLAAAAALAGAAALLVLLFARRTALTVGGEAPGIEVHRRHLEDIDSLARRGLINAEDKASARAEAARRLLTSAERSGPGETAGAPASRRLALAAAAAAGLLSVGLYALLGAPGVADQPYQARLQRWRAADPSRLGPQEIAAVLSALAQERPNDPEVFAFLGRAESASGDAYLASKAFARAAALRPSRADYQLMLGETLLEASQGKPSADGEMALSRAVALDPQDPTPRYILGREELAAGQTSDGVRLLRTVLDHLQPGDPRRGPLSGLIARAESGQPLEAAGAPSAISPATSAPDDPAGAATFIQGMVASLAARLQTHPDDPDGWARLVRSYGVLHDKADQDRALEAARRALRSRPAELSPVLAKARAHPA